MAQTSHTPLLLEVIRAEGSWMYGPAGEKYLDLISGISVSSLGHGNPAIVHAVQEQAARYMHLMVYGELVQQPQLHLATALKSVLHPDLDSFYFVNSGSEAVEGAMKLARRYTGRQSIVAQTDAYHGSTQGALSLMSNEYYSAPFRPLIPGVSFIHQNDRKAIEHLDTDLAALVVELIQGERGAMPADREYIRELREFCTRTGALFIVDEIQSGMGRTGAMFAYEKYMVVPDILLLGKALGGGMPVGAFIAPVHIMRSLADNPVLGHITTFGGHPVCCAAAATAVEITRDELNSFRVEEKEKKIRKMLKHRRIREITGAGLLLAVHLRSEEECRKCISWCLDKGVLTDWFLYAPAALRIAPPLNISDDELKFACQVILEALDNL